MNDAAVIAPSVSVRRYDAHEASDVHAFHQIVLGLDGTMVMAVDGVAERIVAGSAWLVPAGARHDYAGIGENRQLVLDLPLASLAVPQRLFERARAITLAPPLAQRVRDIASCASSDGSAKGRRFHWDAAARLCDALLPAAAASAPGSGLDFARIDHWMRAHLSEPLRVADLAAHCGFGMRRFHQLFDEAFGETPYRYLQRLRLDAAIMLLGDARRSLTEIALDVGFADQSAFTHAFTRRFGLAPGQWRRLRH
jgi:AraC-like DNA-binding protein